MTILKRRYRPITFRVSAEEYEAFTKACVTSAARSVSDFARAAVLQRIQAIGAPAGTLSGDLATLSSALGELDAALHDLSSRIHKVLGDVSAEKKADAASHNKF